MNLKEVEMIGVMKEKQKIEYHTKCHDCGRFLKKSRWVRKDHKWKAHGLCSDCFELYDHPDY